MQKKTRLILHAKHAMNESVRNAVEQLRVQGHNIDVRISWEAEDVAILVAQAISESIETLVAGGGDGTLNAVVSGILRSQAAVLPSVAVLPLGTANDFATYCGIPVDDSYAALRLAVETTPQLIDIGKVGNHFFVNMVTGGFGSEITVGTSREMKTIFGKIAYLLEGVRTLHNVNVQKAVFTSSDFQWQGNFYAFAVGNGRFAGGGIKMCPNASLDDGLLELSILPQSSTNNVSQIFKHLLEQGMTLSEPFGVSHSLTGLTIKADSALHINLDGEPFEMTELSFEILPKRLKFHYSI